MKQIELKGNPKYEEMINRLVSLQGNKKQIEFADEIGINTNNYNAILNFRRPLGDGTILKICTNLNINKKWLVHGVEPKNKQKSNKGIPYYEEVNNMEIMEIEKLTDPAYYVDYKPFNDCTGFIRWSGGDALAPEISNGDAIVIKRMNNLDFLPPGQPYLILTNDEYNNLTLLMKVFKHKDSDKLILKAANPAHDGDMEIMKLGVTAIYIIKGIVKYKGI